MSLLQIDNLTAGYGPITVLRGVSLRLDEGEMVALVGSNGAGKTTLLRSVHGMTTVAAGDITLNDASLHRYTPHHIGGLGVGHVLEGRQLFPGMSVRDNLVLGAYRQEARAQRESNLSRVLELFPVLRERLSQHAGTLSGGEQQMLAVGRALMMRPKVLLVDEPSLGLAPLIVEELFEALKEVRAQGVGVLLAEQNVALALSAADRAYVIEGGEVVLSGPAAGMLENPRVREAYLGTPTGGEVT